MNIKDIVQELEKQLGCHCGDRSDFEREVTTGHLWLCQIHIAAMTIKKTITQEAYNLVVKQQTDKKDVITKRITELEKELSKWRGELKITQAWLDEHLETLHQ